MSLHMQEGFKLNRLWDAIFWLIGLPNLALRRAAQRTALQAALPFLQTPLTIRRQSLV
jgi:hypothetical protein